MKKILALDIATNTGWKTRTASGNKNQLVSEMYVRKQSCLRTINSINKQFSKLLPIIFEI